MKTRGQKAIYPALTLALLLASTNADAFRCGRKLVLENMHEAQVLAICGSPATARNLGYVTRGSYLPSRSRLSGLITSEHFPAFGPFVEQVILTEYVYNFGPRRLMRRLLFEGGILVRIETIGYGYRERHAK